MIPILVTDGLNGSNGEYWVKTKSPILISNIQEQSNISFVNDNGGIEINVPAGSNVNLNVIDSGKNSAILNTPINSEFTVTHKFLGENDNINTITIKGISSGNVNTRVIDNNHIELSGAHNITIEANVDGKTNTKTFNEVKNDDLVIVNVSTINSSLVISINSISSNQPINIAPPIFPNVTPVTDPFVYEEKFNETPVGTIIGTDTSNEKIDETLLDAVIHAKNKTLKVGDKFVFMEGVTAKDDGGRGKDLTRRVTLSGHINTKVPGKYTLLYKVKGQNGNIVPKYITITVVK